MYVGPKLRDGPPLVSTVGVTKHLISYSRLIMNTGVGNLEIRGHGLL
jgi:hypothetical protein